MGIASVCDHCAGLLERHYKADNNLAIHILQHAYWRPFK